MPCGGTMKLWILARLEVERFRLIAESLFQAVTDYPTRASGRGGGTTH